MYRWIKNFLTDRTIATQIEGVTSTKECLKEGIPQGSSLNCTLFTLYISDIVKYLPDTHTALYGDDLVLWSTGIKQQSYLTRSTALLPEYNMPRSKENIATVAPQPLYRTAYQPTLCPHLIVKSASKSIPSAHTGKLGSRDHRHVSKHNDTCLHRWISSECGGASRIWSNHPIPRCNAQRHQ